MHRLLIDINVVLDVVLVRVPHSKSSEKILSYIEKGKAEGDGRNKSPIANR